MNDMYTVMEDFKNLTGRVIVCYVEYTADQYWCDFQAANNGGKFTTFIVLYHISLSHIMTDKGSLYLSPVGTIKAML